MRYPVLASISVILRILGWILICSFAIPILTFVYTMAPASGLATSFPAPDLVTLLLSRYVIAAIVGLVFAGIWLVACGEIIKVLVDIAVNTRSLEDIRRELNYVVERS